MVQNTNTLYSIWLYTIYLCQSFCLGVRGAGLLPHPSSRFIAAIYLPIQWVVVEGSLVRLLGCGWPRVAWSGPWVAQQRTGRQDAPGAARSTHGGRRCRREDRRTQHTLTASQRLTDGTGSAAGALPISIAGNASQSHEKPLRSHADGDQGTGAHREPGDGYGARGEDTREASHGPGGRWQAAPVVTIWKQKPRKGPEASRI